MSRLDLPGKPPPLPDGSDPGEFMLALGARYPSLYHYTRLESLKPLLSSKGLLARPTWDFADTHEYVYGLQVVRSELERVRRSEKLRTEISSHFLAVYGEARPPVMPVLDECVELLASEVEHYNSPRVQVYIACVSSDPLSEKMARNYGACVIGFNRDWIDHWVDANRSVANLPFDELVKSHKESRASRL